MLPTFDRKGFVTAYQEAFAGPPYNEHYTDEEAAAVLDMNHRDGLVMYASHRGKLIGFGCALPFQKSPQAIQNFLTGLEESGDIPAGFDFRNAWYMSELGVLNEYRGVGAAWELVMQRMISISHAGGWQFFMRTAAIGSHSAPMYEKCGAKPLLRIQDLTGTSEAKENQTLSLHRIYLWGDTVACAAEIRKIKESSEKSYPPFESPDELD